ncbi:MAG: exodeoxyribonuclease III [Alphaproteobacteria bacterium]|nr:exodeoxyribonuclease III [Alphaproteobacteria bacterium]
MKIATWNVNSVKARLAHLTRWLKEAAPDVVMLQELKCQTADFPRLEIEAAGYQAEVVGQKAYNGVAILAKHKIEKPIHALPGDHGDDHARYLEATVGGLRVASIYLPNGNPIGTDKFTYKLKFLERLRAHALELLATEAPVVLAGDWNVCPTDEDVWDPKAMAKDALCQPESRAAFRSILHQGWTDAIRAFHPHSREYTYWDYFQNRFERDHGLRIDHLLLSPRAADRLTDAGVDRVPRAWEKASDHTPAWCTLAD